MQIGFIGLGKMGSRMAGKLLNEYDLIVWNRNAEAISNFKFQTSNSGQENKVNFAQTIQELINKLEKPRIIWIMVSHQAVDEVLSEVKKYVSPGDVVIDGGNSNYKDTDKRFEEFEKLGISFLGAGTSGGIKASENGFPFMVGGSRKGYDLISPVLDSLSKPGGGHAYFGKGGAGHFVKMIHNGVEYGMMQSIGEGFEVLEKSEYEINLSEVASLWTKGTIVSGFLMDRSAEMLAQDPKLESFKGAVARSGEGDWTLEVAREEKVMVPSMGVAVDYRKKSEESVQLQNSMTARVLNALRKSFGGHEIKK